MEHIIQLAEENTRVNGNLIWDKAKADKSFQMELDLKDIIIKTKRMEKVDFSWQMVTLTLDSLGIIDDKAKEFLNLVMEDSIRENGWMIKCMGMVNLHGQMEKVTKAIM